MENCYNYIKFGYWFIMAIICLKECDHFVTIILI